MNSPTNSAAESNSRSELVREYVIAHGPCYVEAVAQALGVRRILISRLMSKMATRGQLGHDSTGRYFFLRGPQKLRRKHHIGALAANMPAKAWNSEPGHRGLPSSEDFIRAGGKIEVLPPAAYVAPAIQPVGWAA